MTQSATARELSDLVLPMIRTRSDLHRLGAANAHGRQMHKAVGILEDSIETHDPGELLVIVQKAVASAVTVIMRADDSSGIIGDAIRRLLVLHPKVAGAAQPSAAKLVAWMIKFQIDSDQDFFELDPVAYVPALGEAGMARYRAELAALVEWAGPEPEERIPSYRDGVSYSHTEEYQRQARGRRIRWLAEWSAARFAVVDRDHEAIIATHAKDRKVAAWLHDTAKAFSEIDETDLAIDWAKQAADFDDGFQAQAGAKYWTTLLAEFRPEELLAATLEVFRRWPSADTAEAIFAASGSNWAQHAEAVEAKLAETPSEAVQFALTGLDDPARAWTLAHNLNLRDNWLWEELTFEYEKVNPLAVLPVLTELTEAELEHADARNYKYAARRLNRMRLLAKGSNHALEVDELIARLRAENRHRPRMQREFDKVGLP